MEKELFKYSWLFCGVIWLLIINFQMRLSLKSYLKEKDVKQFQYRMSFAIFMPCILLQTFQICGGYNDPTYFITSDVFSGWRIATLFLIIVCWGLFLYWLWLRKGAEYLSRFSTVLYLPREAKYIRILLTFIVAFSILLGVLHFLFK